MSGKRVIGWRVRYRCGKVRTYCTRSGEYATWSTIPTKPMPRRQARALYRHALAVLRRIKWTEDPKTVRLVRVVKGGAR